jgi:hypothetical protein
MNRETLISKLKDDLAHGRVVTITGTGVSVTACGNQKVDGPRAPAADPGVPLQCSIANRRTTPEFDRGEPLRGRDLGGSRGPAGEAIASPRLAPE